MRLFSILVLALLSACEPQRYWMPEGATSQEFNQEKYECLQNATYMVPAAPGQFTLSGPNPMVLPVDMNNGNRNNLFSACMNSKGWFIVEKPQQQ